MAAPRSMVENHHSPRRRGRWNQSRGCSHPRTWVNCCSVVAVVLRLVQRKVHYCRLQYHTDSVYYWRCRQRSQREDLATIFVVGTCFFGSKWRAHAHFLGEVRIPQLHWRINNVLHAEKVLLSWQEEAVVDMLQRRQSRIIQRGSSW